MCTRTNWLFLILSLVLLSACDADRRTLLHKGCRELKKASVAKHRNKEQASFLQQDAYLSKRLNTCLLVETNVLKQTVELYDIGHNFLPADFATVGDPLLFSCQPLGIAEVLIEGIEKHRGKWEEVDSKEWLSIREASAEGKERFSEAECQQLLNQKLTEIQAEEVEEPLVPRLVKKFFSD